VLASFAPGDAVTLDGVGLKAEIGPSIRTKGTEFVSAGGGRARSCRDGRDEDPSTWKASMSST